MLANADLVEMQRRMLVIRGFEERVSALYRDGEVAGFVHLSIGQEASAGRVPLHDEGRTAGVGSGQQGHPRTTCPSRRWR
jgi:hypothetical protein